MAMLTRFTLILLTVLAVCHGEKFKCPSKFGVFEDPYQCDKYYECSEGVAEEKLCPDGLVFDPYNHKDNKCDHTFNVDCGDRQEIQPARGTKSCPRRNGFFAHPDPSVCHIFFNCIHGEAVQMSCPTGLHFDEYSGTCVWPSTAGRTGCGAKESALPDGFKCPKAEAADERGQPVAHPKYPHPEDCQKFYICLSGVSPREHGCPVGEVYNEELQSCDQPENVQGCEDWYADNPNFRALFTDDNGDGKKDFGKRRVFDQVNVNVNRDRKAKTSSSEATSTST